MGEDAEVNALVAEIIDMLNRGERIYLHCRYPGSLPFSGSCPVVPHLDCARTRSQWRAWTHRHHCLHSSGYALSSLLHEASVSSGSRPLTRKSLKGRLYGLTAYEALELCKRYHDCRADVKAKPGTLRHPHTATTGSLM